MDAIGLSSILATLAGLLVIAAIGLFIWSSRRREIPFDRAGNFHKADDNPSKSIGLFRTRKDWKYISLEEAKRHPYYGFGGWLLFFYVSFALGATENLLIVLAPDLASYVGVEPALRQRALYYGGDIQLMRLMYLLGAASSLPFLVLAPLKHRLMPKIAVCCIWLWLIFWAITYDPPKASLGVFAAVFLLPFSILTTWYLFASKRVNVTYLHRVPAGFDSSLYDNRSRRAKIGHTAFWIFGGFLLFLVIFTILAHFIPPPEMANRSEQQTDATIRYSPRGSSDGATEGNAKSADEIALERSDYATAFKNNLRFAEQGDSASQGNLANFYYLGLGVPRDFAKALFWWRKAAEQNNPAAQYAIGNMYMQGHGVPADGQSAIQWWRKAADQGWPGAQFNLGLYYANLSEIKVTRETIDLVQAFAWFDLATLNYQKEIDAGLDMTRYRDDAINWRDKLRMYLSRSPALLTAAENLSAKWRRTKILK